MLRKLCAWLVCVLGALMTMSLAALAGCGPGWTLLAGLPWLLPVVQDALAD
jgi:hypothetical protein